MYSVLLTAMMSTSPPVPEFGRLFDRGCFGCQGCTGCSGCCGGCSGQCYGCSGCCGGCSGCSGCCGGGFLGLGLFSGSHYSGCCGGCYGCSGCCGGCFGGCYGGYSMPIEYGSGYSFDPGMFGMAGQAMPMMPGAGMGEMFNPGETPAPPMMPPAGLGEALTTPNQATVVVTLPADAKLFGNGEPS